MRILKKYLVHPKFKVQAMCFLPDTLDSDKMAIFTHGYTSSKSSIVNWAIRLCEENIPTVIFDQPGHYLGSFEEIESFDDFTNHAHELFQLAYEWITEFTAKNNFLIIGGHSLGALMSIKALNLFNHIENKVAIAVGYGLNPDQKVHLFDTPLFEKTIAIRNQLVSPHLDKDKMFPWIRNQKENFHISGKRIHLICGANDVVVGRGGAEYLRTLLAVDNEVTLEEPKALAHHQPELAAPHIYSFIKKLL
jgi:hypothetical protein